MSDSTSAAGPQLDKILNDFLDTCDSLQITVEEETVHPIKAGTVLDDDQNPTYCGIALSDEFFDLLDAIMYALYKLNGGRTKVLDEGTVMFLAKNVDLIAHLRRLQRVRLEGVGTSGQQGGPSLILPLNIEFSDRPPSVALDLRAPMDDDVLKAIAFLEQIKKPAALRWLYDVLHKELKVRHLDASTQMSH